MVPGQQYYPQQYGMPAGGYRQFYPGMQHAGQNQGQNTMHQPTPPVIYRGPAGTPTTNQPGGETAAATPAAAAPKPAAKKRVFKGLKIVNPDTKEEVKVVKPKPKAVEEVAKKEGAAATAATAGGSGTSSPAGGTPKRERKPILIVDPNAGAKKADGPPAGTKKAAAAAPPPVKKETMAEKLKRQAANPPQK